MNRRTIIAIPVGLVLLAGLVALGIYLFSPKQQIVREEKSFSMESIEQYLKGDELRALVLQSYLDSCEMALAHPTAKMDTVLMKDLKDRLTVAIAWRQALDSANFVVTATKYFPCDSALYKAILNIEPQQRNLIAIALRDSMAQMPQHTLPEIESLIVNLGRFFEIRAYYDKRSGLIDEPDNFDGVKWQNVADHLSKEECHNAIAKLKAVQLPELKVVNQFVKPLVARYGQEDADTIPAEKTVKSVAAPAQPVYSAKDVMNHTVQKGETLNAIARQYGVTAKELQQLNNLSDEAADHLKIDQVIRVPKK